MLISVRISVFTIVACVAVTAVAAEKQAAAPDYQKDIAPIFAKYCTGCHSADEPEGKLNLESFDGLLKGGKRGVVLVSKQSDASRLLLVLDGRVKPAMPPKDSEAPTAEEIALIKAWIDAGGKGPSGAMPDPTKLITPKVPLKVAARQAITAIAVSGDGKLAALGGYGEVQLISTASRSVVRKLTNLRGPVADLEFTADGKQLLTAAGEPGVFGEAQLWNVADGKLLKTFTGHRDSLYSATLSPNGKQLATGSYDQQIQLWDVMSGKKLKTLSGHNGAVFDLAFRPDGKVLASASADRTIKLWNPESGDRLDTLGQPLKEQYTVAFSPDGKKLLAGGADNRIRVYRVSDTAAENSNPLEVTRFAHEGAVLRLAFSPNGKVLASTGEDRRLRLWKTTDYTEQKQLEAQSDWAVALSFASDNKSLFLGRLDGSYGVYDAMTGKPVPPAKPMLASATPRGITRGETTKVLLKGEGLAGVKQLQFRLMGKPSDGATVKLLPQDDNYPDELWAEITPTVDLQRDSYALVVTTPNGESNELTLWVDNLPQLAEAEPNNEPSQVSSVALGASYWGVLPMPGDQDFFQFEARAGQTIVCELSARRINSSLNGVLTLHDAEGNVVERSNDFGGNEDPFLAYKIPKNGTYRVNVASLKMSGTPQHFYRLTIGQLPYVTAVYPLSVQVGKTATVDLIGYNLPKKSKVRLKAAKAGEQIVPLDRNRYRSVATTLKVQATDQPEMLEQEPNNLVEQAMPITTPGNVHGRIMAAASVNEPDTDLYRFESKQGQSWIIETEATRHNSPTDTKIEVLDAQGRPIERTLLQAVRDSNVTFRSIDSESMEARITNWEEMALNEYLYMQGEVCKIFRMPQGSDSGFQFYPSINANRRKCYFDTSPTAHALDAACYIVEAHAPNTKLSPNGLPVFKVHYTNDDDSLRKSGTDSRLMFVAPADGTYLVRVSDVRGFGGDRFVYRLSVRQPRPDFVVTVSKSGDENDVKVSVGSGVSLRFVVDRIDGFNDDITVRIENLPPGFHVATPIVIQAGHDRAMTPLTVDANAPKPADDAWSKVKITAEAQIEEKMVSYPVTLPQPYTLVPAPTLLIRLEPAELTIAPGQTITAQLKIERRGHKGAVNFDVDNLPFGVVVDNIGLNGILIPENQTERQIFISAIIDVPDMDRPFYAKNKSNRFSTVGEQVSPPIMLHVRRPSAMAQAPSNEP